MVDIDNKSYIEHDLGYKTNSDLEHCKKSFDNFKDIEAFRIWGFKKIIDLYPEVRDLHVDIGSGGGWLLAETAPFFDKVIGIEPSSAAIDISKKLFSNLTNVEYICLEMLEAIDKVSFEKPIFFTSSTVFSHINDDTVLEFLKKINKASNNSILYFLEPYGKNKQQYLWHIRNKEWWAKALPDWELTFEDYQDGGYFRGISGVRVGRDKVNKKYKTSFSEKFFWSLSGIFSRTKLLVRKILKKA